MEACDPIPPVTSGPAAMSRRVRGGFVIALGAVVLLALLMYQRSNAVARNTRALTPALDTQENLQQLLLTLPEAETSLNRYLLTNDNDCLGPYRSGVGRAPAVMVQIENNLSGDRARTNGSRLAALVTRQLAIMADTLTLYRQRG